MRLICLLLAAASGIAHADTAWDEYSANVRLRSAEAITETACEIDVKLHGAIAEVEQRVRLANQATEPFAATTVLAIPADAVMVGLEYKEGNRAASAALAVTTGAQTERVTSPTVLDGDPALLEALAPEDGRARYRVIVQPIAPEQEVTITTRWIRAADIRGGALHLVLPGREGKLCRGTVHAKPGPGATVARVRVGRVESATRSFSLDRTDVALDVDLAFKRNEPLLWTQTEALGKNISAQAVTILTPPARASDAKRVLFVVDGSRSMELVGRNRVKQVVHSIAGMLARGTEVEAIIYDRTATRVLGSWKAIDATQLAAIETAIDTHTAANGSNAQAALALAQQAIGMQRETQIVVITDGVMSDDRTPTGALSTLQVELHAIVLSNGRMRSPDAEPLRSAINRIGGSYTELDVSELDTALAAFDDWLRPSWHELTVGTAFPKVDGIHGGGLAPFDGIPSELRAGSGIVVTTVDETLRRPTLTGHTTKAVKVVATSGPAAPIAELALSRATLEDTTDLPLLRARHPAVDDAHTFVVLAARGKIATSRRQVTASGGPFTRMVVLDDPHFPPETRSVAPPAVGGSAIDRNALEVLFKTQLQPAAFACYQRALARLPKLTGTAQFHIEIGRGETTHAKVTGLGDATLDACLLDAAYGVTPSLPNPAYNSDDRTIANYPLTFSVREQKPFVIAGDADSSSPLDIDSIKGGVPIKLTPGEVSTPLGNLRPSKLP
jgi:hypothetical protein